MAAMPFANITTALAIFALGLFAASHGHGALANVDHDLALRNTETMLRAKGPTEAAIGENPSKESIATFDTVAFPTTSPTGLTALDQAAQKSDGVAPPNANPLNARSLRRQMNTSRLESGTVRGQLRAENQNIYGQIDTARTWSVGHEENTDAAGQHRLRRDASGSSSGSSSGSYSGSLTYADDGCECAASWTTPGDDCHSEQTGCTNCDDDENGPWCLCADNLDYWIYCEIGSDRLTNIQLRQRVEEWLANKKEARKKYGKIGEWDTSAVTSTANLFEGASSFNDDISKWVLSSTSSTREMFWGASSFDGDVSNWDLSSAVDSGFMFEDASSFKGDGVTNWDLSSVTDTSGMFEGATSFNGNVAQWNLSSVTDTSAMFYGAINFNSNVESWDLSSTTTTKGMFLGATSFDGDVSKWTMSSVTDTSYMFQEAASFDGNLSNWNLSSVTDTSYMFFSASSFNGDGVASWDLSSTEDTTAMFNGAASFNGDVASWKLSSSTNTQYMFTGTLSLNQDLSGWHTADTSTSGSMPIADMQCSTDKNNRLQCPAIACSAGNNGGRCCSDSTQTVPRCASCTEHNECFRLPTVPKTLAIKDTDGEPFPAEMTVNEYRPIEWNTYVNTADLYTSFKREAPDKLVFQIQWLKPDSANEAWMKVGGNPPAGYQWDEDKGPRGIGMDSETGKIFAESEKIGSYTAWLIAVDDSRPAKGGGGPAELDQVLIKKWDLAVVAAPTAPSILLFKRAARSSNTNPAYLVDVEANREQSKECGYSEPCEFNEVEDVVTRYDADASTDTDFSYAVDVQCKNIPTGAEPEFLINGKTGFITGTFPEDSASSNKEPRSCILTFTATTRGFLPRPIEIIKVTAVKRAVASAGLAVGGGVAGGFVFVLLVLGFVYRHHMYQVKMRAFDFAAELSMLMENGTIDKSENTLGVPREIKRSDITMVQAIGQGAFGEVWKGILDESSSNGGVPGYMVAIKTAKEAGGAGADDMVTEATVMSQIKPHNNVVSLIGVVTSGVPLLLLISIDLAARNVLLDSTFQAKIADFGLARGIKSAKEGPEKDADGGEEEYYRSQNGVFPVRWCAPEAMATMRFSEASDVWSFAVVCLEIFTDGEKPYTGMDNAAVINKVQAGYRAPKPPTCTGMFYAVLLSCWNAIPIKRMTFSQIATVIGPMVPGGTAIQAITFNASRAFSSSHDQGGSKTSLDSQSSSDESLEDYADMSGQAEVQVNEEAHTRARRVSLDRDSEVAAADDAAAAIADNGGRQAVSAKKKKKKKEKKKNSKMKQGSSAKQTDTNDGGYMAVTSTPGGKAAEETKKKGSSKKKTEMRQEAALVFNSDTYMQVEDPRAMPAVPPTIESAYLQIGQSRDGVQKQNPIFAE